MRVLITDSDLGPPDIEEQVCRRVGAELVVRQCRTPQQVLDALEDVRPTGLLVQYAPITAEVIAAAQEVRAVARYGVGLDTIDVLAAQAAGITVLNVPDYATAEVADHTVALMLALIRRVRMWSDMTRAGTWLTDAASEDLPPGLCSMTVGLLGFGRIAQAVASRVRAFGALVAAHDPFIPSSQFNSIGVRSFGFDDLLRSANLLSVHVPLSVETECILNEQSFALMPHRSFLVNTARARVIDRRGLEVALSERRLAGVAIDGWWDEPPRKDDPLLQDERILVTPHVAYLSASSLAKLRREATERLVTALTLGE